jgi:hypothetical protein
MGKNKKQNLYLCERCKNGIDCFLRRGVIRENECAEYTALTKTEWLAKNAFLNALIVGKCPKCGSENTCDCEDVESIENWTVAYCLDCKTYWCSECGYIFENSERKKECSCRQICEKCKNINGYMDLEEFIEKVCSDCEHFVNNICLLKPYNCDKDKGVLCPYDKKGNIQSCLAIKRCLKERTASRLKL